MLVESERFKELWDSVRDDKHQSEDKSILVFVANGDVDSVCAVRQLREILTAEESAFSQFPVESYNEIAEQCRNIVDTEELRTIILINCGATERARDICGLENNPNVRLIIIDSHRPVWSGYNDGDTNTLVFVDADDPVPKISVPYPEPGDEHLRLGHVREYLLETGQQGEDGDGDDDEASPSSPKRRRTDTLDSRAKERQAELEAYYSEKCGYGKPSAVLLYDLASTLNLGSVKLLWQAVLGLTDQLVHQRCARDHYDRWRRGLEQELQRMTGTLTDATNSGATQQTRHDTLSIVRITDMRLTLLRSWSLIESLQQTSYVASRMQTWTEKGRSNVKLMMAKMGIKLENAQAAYSAVSSRYMDQLPTLLERHGGEFGLNVESLQVEGFELRYKSDIRLSATDAVHMITMALAKPRSTPTPEVAKDTFHNAAALLDVEKMGGGSKGLKDGMEQVKKVCSAVVTQGGLAISRKQVHGARKALFWHLNMADLEFANKAEFQHPCALVHLALFLRDAMTRRTNTVKAMVVVGPPDANDRCYVVAVRRKEEAGVMQNNPFARAFDEVVENLHLDRHLDRSMFDPTLYHIRRADASSWIEELKAVVSSYEAGARMADAVAA